MKKRMILFTCLIGMALSSFSCFAYVPYDSYTYSTHTGSPVAQYCPTPYYPFGSIDKSTIGVPLVTPADMCFDKEGNLYIADSTQNKIIILDKNYQLKKVLSDFTEKDGLPGFFGGPEGLFVDPDLNLYVCDTNQKRILLFDKDYQLTAKYEGIKPLSGTGDEEYLFLPSKIIVDSAKNMYVLVQNEYQGIMQLDGSGKFISFIGGNKVTYDPITKFWKSIMSKQQKKQMDQFLPIEYTNISLDHEGLIYTVSKNTSTSAPIKRINLSGKDVLIRNGYINVTGDVKTENSGAKFEPSLFSDITSDEKGVAYALDASKGRIFVYNNEGFLFFAFGGLGTQLGTFVSPSAIEVNGTDILVADLGNPRITIFRQTEYAALISKADDSYNKGNYEESVGYWEEVVKRNSNFELAYAQIGKVYLRKNDYKTAMKYFELGNFRGDKITATSGYNKAFSENRRETAAKWLGPFVIMIVLLIVAGLIIKAVRRKRYERKN